MNSSSLFFTLPRPRSLFCGANLRMVILVSWAVWFVPQQAFGETHPVPPISPEIIAQVGWVRLYQATVDYVIPAKIDPADRAKLQQGLIDLADRAHGFAQSHPDSVYAPKAEQVEALLLIRAAELGDKANTARLATLVASVRGNQKLPEHERFVVAARANELAIEQTPKITHADRLAAYEKSAQALTVEFPGETEAYESLGALAEDLPDMAAGVALAQEITGMNAPEAVKARARMIVARAALVGQSPDITGLDDAALSASLKRALPKPLLVYTWSAANPRSLAMAKWLKEHVSDRAILVGVNLDTDITGARAKADASTLAATQIYNPLGAESVWAKQLCLTRPGLIYLFDRKRVLREVRGEQDFQRKIAAVLTGGAS